MLLPLQLTPWLFWPHNRHTLLCPHLPMAAGYFEAKYLVPAAESSNSCGHAQLQLARAPDSAHNSRACAKHAVPMPTDAAVCDLTLRAASRLLLATVDGPLAPSESLDSAAEEPADVESGSYMVS